MRVVSAQMRLNPSIDSVIAPIATSFQGCADELLDIREAAMQRRQPGKCVACFYKVMGIAQRRQKANALKQLQCWIEDHLEIVAEDEHHAELERMGVHLDDSDLESYCQNIISQMHFDRSYASRHITLKFVYKEAYVA